MKLLHVQRARSIWLLPGEDLNPRGLDPIPIFTAIQSRYRFQISPTKPEHIYDAPGGVAFGRGSFGLENGERVEVESAKLYRDGITADTSHSSNVSDAFLNDVLTFLSQRHGLAFKAEMIRKKAYVSELVVSTKLNLDDLNKHFREFTSLLAEQTGEGREFRTIAVRFGTDPERQAPLEFYFERRLGSPFSENRYFSSAPLTTDKHLEVLNAWEKMLTTK